MREEKNILHVFGILWKWRKHILIATALFAVCSIIISLLLSNYYESSATFYAASTDLAKPAPIGNQDRRINYYGNDDDVDRLLTIAHSTKLKNHLIDKFELYQHYKIDQSRPKSAYEIRLKLEKLMRIQKTEFQAIQFGIEDQDPEMAKKMIDEAIQYLNLNGLNNIKKSQNHLLKSMNEKIERNDKNLIVLNDSISLLKEKYQAFDLQNQNEILLTRKGDISSKLMLNKTKKNLQTNQDSTQYYQALVDAYETEMKSIQSSIKSLNKGFNQIVNLDRERNEISKQLAIDKERKKQLEASAIANSPSLLIVEESETPIHKSRPARSLLVIGMTALGFVLSAFFALLAEVYRKIDWHKYQS